MSNNEKPLSEFKVSMMKKNPKPNAPRYEITTIEEMFKVLDQTNYKRFLKDFKSMVEMTVHMKALIDTLSEGQTLSEDQKDAVKMKKFTWIDD